MKKLSLKLADEKKESTTEWWKVVAGAHGYKVT